jgi:RNA polymerase sigma-70 factor (ECF subfamily)
MERPASARSVTRLVEAYYAGLYRYAFRLAGDAADAEDLTQETFCKAQMRLHQLRDPGRVRPWLFAILRNCYLRKRRDEPEEKHLPMEAADTQVNADDEAPDAEELQRALNRLPEAYRTPLILFYFESFSYREIADQMGVPIGTVMSRLSRAKAFLRQLLADEVPEPRLAAREGAP